MSAPDRIELRGLRVWGHHGVLPHEQELGQQFVIDVVLHLDTRTAARTDALADTVDYGALALRIRDVVATERCDLIEALAHRVAQVGLDSGGDYGSPTWVDAVDVAVHKPYAPVTVPFADVVVSCHRRAPVPVVLALGANLGDPVAAVRDGIEALRERPGLDVDETSPLVRTAPVGGVEQDDFVNAVVLAHTTLGPHELLSACQAVEHSAGRVREIRWGPRTLDVDVILYGDRTLHDERLTVPHPRAHERAFVLVPWAQADPSARFPDGRLVRELAEVAPDRDGVRQIEETR